MAVSGMGAGRGGRPMLLIVGRSATGKDTLAEILEGRGMRSVISHTTRPRRGPSDTRHVFVSEAEADRLVADAVAVTEIGGYRYFATRGDVDAADIYVIDPSGIGELLDNMPGARFVACLMVADAGERRRRAIARADDAAAAAEAFDVRERCEDADFVGFGQDVVAGRLPRGIVATLVVRNDYEPPTLERAADALCGMIGALGDE